MLKENRTFLASSSVEQHEMLQHLVFEDVLEARRCSNELLSIASLDSIAHGRVFGDLGLGDGVSRVACRTRALGNGCGRGYGRFCLLVGRHAGCVYLHGQQCLLQYSCNYTSRR